MPRLLLLLLLPALVTVGCASKTTPQLQGAAYYFDKGESDFEKGRYLEAVESFQRIVSNFPGHARIADAQFYLAESYYELEDYVNAIFEYERLIDTYPSSPWRDEAQLRIGEAYFEQSRRAELDQTETYRAIAAFRRFIEDNPDSPHVVRARDRIVECRSRLAKKDYLAARLYHRQGHLQAARMTYEQLLRNYPLTRWYWHGLAQLGDIARRQGNAVEARQHFEEVLHGAEEEDLQNMAREGLTALEADE